MNDETEENEEREKYIEELVAKYSIRELKEIVRSLDLNPDDYTNKRAIAIAILDAHESARA